MNISKDSNCSKSEAAIVGEIVSKIRTLVPADLAQPRIGIVCGSGLNGIWERVMLGDGNGNGNRDGYNPPSPPVALSFESIGFGSPTIPGHGGQCLFGKHQRTGIPVVCMVGRLHHYEGHSMAAILRPVRVMAALGVQTLLLTNASGSLLAPAQLDSGDFMVIEDHLSMPGLTGNGPLCGPNYGNGPRFLPCTQLYHPRSHEWVFKAAAMDHPPIPASLIKRGVYAAVGGPSYETPAECRALRALGASSVGMSTAPEAIAASHAGIPRIIAISLISNVCVLELPSSSSTNSSSTPPTHEEVLATTAARKIEAARLVDNLFTVIYEAEKDA